MGSSLHKDEREILEKKFAKIDTNGDGRISKEEMYEHFKSSGAFFAKETFIKFYVSFTIFIVLLFNNLLKIKLVLLC